MRRVCTATDLRSAIGAWRARPEGTRIAFVPTMGALHEGHLSLVRLARELADRVVASIFVNPAQFNVASDLERYPRTPERDATLLESAGCDLLFLPDEPTLYPPGHSTWVVPAGPAEGLESDHRPGHFRGVATVVLALFELVRPDLAVFGEKDAQQLAVVRRMVRDLHLAVEIVAGPTVREPDGLAMSSRNALLSPEERRSAAVLHRALRAAEAAAVHGARPAETAALGGRGPGGSRATPGTPRVAADDLRKILLDTLATEPLARVDYAEVVDAASFRPLDGELAGEVVLPIAVWIGETRLIDNLRLDLDTRST